MVVMWVSQTTTIENIYVKKFAFEFFITMAEITNEQETTKLKLAKFANKQNHTSSMLDLH